MVLEKKLFKKLQLSQAKLALTKSHKTQLTGAGVTCSRKDGRELTPGAKL